MVLSLLMRCSQSFSPLPLGMALLRSHKRVHLPVLMSRNSVHRLLQTLWKPPRRKVTRYVLALHEIVVFKTCFLRQWCGAEAKLQRAAEYFLPSSSESDEGPESSDEDAETSARKGSMQSEGTARVHERDHKKKRKRHKCVIGAALLLA